MYTCRTLLARYSLLTRRGAATLSPLAVTIRFTPMVPKGHIVIRRGGEGGEGLGRKRKRYEMFRVWPERVA